MNKRAADILLTPIQLGDLQLQNRIVMAPMTRNRADSLGVPGPLMVEHYAQRASAGLIVAEGTWPSVTGQAYCRQPGIETAAQIGAWRRVTDAVHARGGCIVLQCDTGQCQRASIGGQCTGQQLQQGAFAAAIIP